MQWHQRIKIIRVIAEELSTIQGLDGGAVYNLACMSLYLEQPARAMELLRRAVAMGFNSIDTFRTDPDLRSLQGTPDFETLMEELGAARNA